MKRPLLILIVFVGFLNSLFSQDATNRNEFNRLLCGLWKTESGSIISLENLVGKFTEVSENAKKSGWYQGEIISKDFKYVSMNIFEYNVKLKLKNLNETREQWIKAKITVYDNYYIVEYIETPTVFWNNAPLAPKKYYLFEKRTLYPPELVVE